MAQYSGALTSSGFPELAEVGTVDFPAMTERRAMHVNLRDSSGRELTGIFSPFGEVPGLDPESPLWIRNIDKQDVLTHPELSSRGLPYGVIVSTSAVPLCAANVARKSLIITNNSTGSLYVGHDQYLLGSGKTMGHLLTASGGSLTDSGDGIWVGEWWGIYSAVATAENVSVSDLS